MTAAEVRDQEKKRRKFTFLVYLFAVIIAISLCGGGLAIYDRFTTTNYRRAQQTLINTRVQQATLADCREIEKLKTAQRTAAIVNFKRLDRNARLLGITVTPELRKAARENKDEALARFAAEPCPRPLKGVHK